MAQTSAQPCRFAAQLILAQLIPASVLQQLIPAFHVVGSTVNPAAPPQAFTPRLIPRGQVPPGSPVMVLGTGSGLLLADLGNSPAQTQLLTGLLHPTATHNHTKD